MLIKAAWIQDKKVKTYWSAYGGKPCKVQREENIILVCVGGKEGEQCRSHRAKHGPQLTRCKPCYRLTRITEHMAERWEVSSRRPHHSQGGKTNRFFRRLWNSVQTMFLPLIQSSRKKRTRHCATTASTVLFPLGRKEGSVDTQKAHFAPRAEIFKAFRLHRGHQCLSPQQNPSSRMHPWAKPHNKTQNKQLKQLSSY